jgi:hypothetical protein
VTKWGDSSRDWDRRAKVLTAVGAPIGAIAALVSFTNNEQLIRVSSGIVAGVSFVGAAVGFFFVLRSSREQKREDVAALDVLLRTRVARVADIDPVMIGVDEAATTELTPAGEMEYLPRVADAELKGLIADALDGRGRWFVVVEGTSKTGKSRTLFEALKTADRDEQLHLFAPRGSAELLQILKRPEPIKTAGRLVLWLNDIEPLVAQGMAYDDLTRFREVYPGGLVVGTYGGKTEEAAAAVGEARLAPLAEAVLNHAARVLLPMTSAPELASLVTEMTAGARADLERYGLAAYLVAGPQVQAKVVAGLHPGRSPSQLGSAIVNAVLDWARCGRTTPLPEPDLRSLVQEYDPQGPPVTDSDFASALEWALLPMAGRVTVIHRVKDGLGAFDYARAVRASQTPTPHIPEAVWTAAAQTCREAEAAVVGEAAYVSGQLEVALIALSAAAESNDAPLVGIALFNKGVTLGQLDRSEAAVAVYDLIESRYGTDPTPALREIVATALYNKGFRLGQLDRSEEEVAVYDLIESRYGTDPRLAAIIEHARALRQAAREQQVP